MLGQFETLFLKFFGRINRSQKFVIQLVGGLNFAPQLRRPLLRHMAIRTDHPDTAGVFVVNRLFVFLIDQLIHFVARHAEFQSVGVFHSCVEATPENTPATPPAIKISPQACRLAGRQNHLNRVRIIGHPPLL